MISLRNSAGQKKMKLRRGMARFMAMVLAVLAGGMICAAEAYEVISGNLLLNPGWEEGLDGWEILADSRRESLGDHEVLCSIVYQDVPVEEDMKGRSVKLSGTIGTAPEDPSQESIHLAMIMCGADGYVVDGIADDGSFLYDDYVSEETAQMTHHEIIMDVPPAADHIRVSMEIRKQGMENSFNFNDLCLEVIEKNALYDNPFTRNTGNENDPEEQTPARKALVETGKAYYNGTSQDGYDREKAEECFREAAQAGNGEALYYLGNLEMNSIDPDRYAQAMEYYEKAYACGFGPGLVGQAMLYEDGLGVEQDYAKAFDLYTRAAEEGYAEGYCGLGNLYRHGNGVSPDEEAAMEYYRMALESEDYIWRNFAKCQLAKMYMADIPGIGPDYSSAYYWYIQAANEGYGSGFIGIANMYYAGKGVDQSRPDAFEWYKRAAAHGNPAGMYSAGFMLEHGQGTARDYEQALRYYEQAANLGDEDAMYRAGLICANTDGEYGTTGMPEQAAYWLSLALQFTDDQERIDSINEILPYVTPGY